VRPAHCDYPEIIEAALLSDRWRSLQQLLEDGVSRHVYTAAVALVGLKGNLWWEGAAGRLTRQPEAAAVTRDTIFDLASLTKPLATTLALMILVDRGLLGLTTTLGEILPHDWLPPDKHILTLRSLLIHRSGLPAWRPFYGEVLAAPIKARPALLERLAAAAPLEHAPDTVSVYSDLGFMLLKAVVEQVNGMGLNKFCREKIYRPLGLNILGFIPLPKPAQAVLTSEKPKTQNRSYAATEIGLIPGRPISGAVHDENAWAAGGVAGHAGLFGTGQEVFALAACLYRSFAGEKVEPFNPEVVKRFFTVPPGADRAHGFDTPDADPAQRAAGRYFSANSVGHLGFTGTSFWLDLATGQMVVLLTNRVHLGRDDKTKIAAFRPRFHEAASRALGFHKV
jgi:CubicO group peptidase (beta-lactamase class C family)